MQRVIKFRNYCSEKKLFSISEYSENLRLVLHSYRIEFEINLCRMSSIRRRYCRLGLVDTESAFYVHCKDEENEWMNKTLIGN